MITKQILRKLNHHRTTELYFVGYPKTGNTWVRYMLGRYVQSLCGLPKLPLFEAVDTLGRCKRYCVGPAMQFTHRPLIWHEQSAADLGCENVINPYRKKRVVLLVRHPLDTLVSLWMQRRHRSGENYSGSLPELLDDPVWGLEKYFRFYSLWFQHRNRVRDFFLLRYEDMRANPHSVFAGLVDFLALPRREDELRRAIADADFESMRKVELSDDTPKYCLSGQSIFASGDHNNADALHVRRGKVGGYRDYIDGDAAERLVGLIDGRLSKFFGYSHPR